LKYLSTWTNVAKWPKFRPNNSKGCRKKLVGQEKLDKRKSLKSGRKIKIYLQFCIHNTSRVSYC
jgi:hypothetical protein